jgi:ParB family chromosome partitioning protein
VKGKRPALGRGLGALLPPAPPRPPSAATAATTGASEGDAPALAGALRTVAIEAVAPNPDQPRKRFDPTALAELATSIRSQGIIQPLVVAPVQPGQARNGARYVIVAGERRWRAAQLAGLHDVPVVVRDTPEEQRLELALVENVQRADLNPIEEARAYSVLVDLRGYTQEQLAERVGKDRTTIANALRLLRLPDRVQDLVREGRLSMGHARALLGLAHERDMIAVAEEAVSGKLSVRAVERVVRARERPTEPEPGDDAARRRIIVGELEDRLRRRLGVRVRLRAQRGRKDAGTLEIPYGSLDELDRLLHLILDRGP